MKSVKISCPTSVPPLKRQTPGCNLRWGEYQFYVNENIKEVDYWFVFDEIPNESESSFCSPQNVFLVTGEPPWVRLYSKLFTNQFSIVLSCQKNILKRKNAQRSIPLLPWMAGARQIDGMNVWDMTHFLDYDYFVNDNPTRKMNKIGVVTSNKTITKGHRKRLDFVYYLKSIFPNDIDIYGNGFAPIADKYEVLSRYKYMIVIENCEYPSYWTEKLADSYLCNCYPFYIGAPDIYNYFNSNSLTRLSMDDRDSAVEAIKNALADDYYSQKEKYVVDSKSLILNKYNMFSQLSLFLDNLSQKRITEQPRRDVTIRMLNDFECKLKNKINRFIPIDF